MLQTYNIHIYLAVSAVLMARMEVILQMWGHAKSVQTRKKLDSSGKFAAFAVTSKKQLFQPSAQGQKP